MIFRRIPIQTAGPQMGVHLPQPPLERDLSARCARLPHNFVGCADPQRVRVNKKTFFKLIFFATVQEIVKLLIDYGMISGVRFGGNFGGVDFGLNFGVKFGVRFGGWILE